MNGNLQGFDAATVERQASFELLPSGNYRVVITRSELKTTRAGDGKYLALTMQILSGKHMNRFLFDNLNITNQNPKTVAIAKSRLAEICEAVGVITPGDSSELHDKPFVAVVSVGKRKDTGEDQNKIKRYCSSESMPISDTDSDINSDINSDAGVVAQQKVPW